MTAATDAALLLTNRIAPIGTEPFKAKEYWALVDLVDPGTLMGRPATDLAHEVGGLERAQRIALLLDAATGFAVAREDLETRGIRLLAPGDGFYPERLLDQLGSAAPPMLYAAGPVEWLGTPLARSTEPPESGPGLVTDGSDDELAAIERAAEAGIPNVAVVADGLVVAGRQKELRRHVGAQRLLLVSPFAPDAIATPRTVAACAPIIDALAVAP